MLRNCKVIALLVFHLFVSEISAQSDDEKQEIIAKYNQRDLQELQNKFSSEFKENYELALKLAQRNGWELRIVNKDGSVSELVGVTEDKRPVYHSTENEGAGITSRANTLYPGGSLGLNVTGNGMSLSLWEIDAVRETHQLYEGRLTQIDADALSDHATHVAGTIIGSVAYQGGAARGMAYEANIRAFNSSNDEAEVVSEAAAGNLLSSHSYGITADGQPSYYLGKYDGNARDFDDIMYNAPYYLGVFSAGNDRNNNINPSGYDLLTDMSCNKNGITVAATYETLNYTGPNSVSMTSFSSWGPTDDGRIKPDISAKGYQLYSASSSSNTSYGYKSGTSMATPSTSGTLLLIQQHYYNVNSAYMLSSTLRALVLHTADEAGSADGPDYEYGWGLINAERAAQTINKTGVETIIDEITLQPGQTYSINVTASGLEDLMATIAWTDPAGTVGPNIVNDRTPSLINDLDIRITQSGTTYQPWKLNPDAPSNAAITGDNIVDNIEKVEVNNPTGQYTITITHKGALSGGSQVFSLIVTGLDINLVPDCAGVQGGNAYYDDCTTCVGGITGLIACTQDCNGDWGGAAYLDNCSDCVDGNTGLTPCIAYCPSEYTQTSGEYITNVSFNTIANPSGIAANNGYEDFTAISTTVNPGSVYQLSVTINTVGNYQDHCQAFFDWNNDMDFTDAGEMFDLGDITNVTAGVLTTTVTVPTNAVLVSTRMRINIEYNVNPGPCDDDHSSEWGETEDYSVNITNSVDCAGVSGGTAFYDNCNTCAGGTTGITACTQDCNGDWGGTAYLDNCSDCVDGNTGVTPCVAYCTSEYTQTGGEYITNVSFNTITNSSGAATINGYEDFTAISTTVNPGSVYQLSVTINTVGNYQDHCQAFFDWNNDMDFTDVGEMFDLGDITNVTAGVLTTTVTVPSNAILASTRMRINIEYNVNPGPCDDDHSSEWGETEDYSVNITNSVDCAGVSGGTAFYDNCNTCAGGTTGITACTQDCNGDWGGTAYLDNCSDCVDGNTGSIACVQDCNGDLGGTAYYDNCNTCIGGTTGLTACTQDCNGDWGGNGVVEVLGGAIDETCELSNGEIEVSVTGGFSPYQYSVDSGFAFQGTNTFGGLTAGSYDIVVVDVNGCEGQANINLLNIGGVSSSISSDQSICSGNSTMITAGGAGTGGDYIWSQGLGNGSTHTVLPVTTTTYTVIISDVYGCQATESTTVTVIEVPIVTVTPASPMICAGENVALEASGAQTYVWNMGISTPNITVSPANQTSYSVIGQNGVCSSELTSVIVSVAPSPIVIASANTISGSIGDVINFSSFGSNAQSYYWDFGDGSNSLSNSPSHTFNSAGIYDVILSGNNGDCSSSDTLTVYIEVVGIKGLNDESKITIYPNPNTGKFKLLANLSSESDLKVSIYNMLGEVIEVKQINYVSNKVVDFELSEIETGMYLIVIESEIYNFTKTISIVR